MVRLFIFIKLSIQFIKRFIVSKCTQEFKSNFKKPTNSKWGTIVYFSHLFGNMVHGIGPYVTKGYETLTLSCPCTTTIKLFANYNRYLCQYNHTHLLDGSSHGGHSSSLSPRAAHTGQILGHWNRHLGASLLQKICKDVKKHKWQLTGSWAKRIWTVFNFLVECLFPRLRRWQMLRTGNRQFL